MAWETPAPPAATPPRRRRVWVAVAAAVLATLLLGIYIGMLLGGPRAPPAPPPAAGAQGIRLNLPAVDSEGNGVVATLTTRVQPGPGLVLVSVNGAKPAPDTQASALTAARVAANLTGRSLDAVDVIFSIEAEAQVVEGPSAGAAMAVAAAAALEGRALRRDVTITGSVDENGLIGQVGAIEEKARAARAHGATLFLVPPGQNAAGIETRPLRACETENGIRFCRVEFEEMTVDLGDRVGLRVVEVATVEEALEHFYG